MNNCSGWPKFILFLRPSSSPLCFRNLSGGVRAEARTQVFPATAKGLPFTRCAFQGPCLGEIVLFMGRFWAPLDPPQTAVGGMLALCWVCLTFQIEGEADCCGFEDGGAFISI